MGWLDGITNSMDMSLGQGSLGCSSSWGRKELDMTEQLNGNNSACKLNKQGGNTQEVGFYFSITKITHTHENN